tara:strand:- start:633 stop:1460 length:828 start_codon:yes stop_codon:yes gene_type:complete
MLRAAKSIKFGKDRLISQNGMLLSPVINLCGLILRADRPLPEIIKNFLDSKGLEVSIVQYKEDSYVRLRGIYTIDKSDIETFINNHTDLINEQKIGLNEAPPTVSLRQEISDKVDQIDALRGPMVVHKQGTNYTWEPSVMLGNNITARISKKYSNIGGRIASRLETHISTPIFISHGQQLQGIGFFADVTAKTNLTINSQVGTQDNTLTEAGENLTIDAYDTSTPSEERLTLNPSVRWLNNPHQDFLQTSEPVDTDELLATADEMLMRIRMGGVI